MEHTRWNTQCTCSIERSCNLVKHRISIVQHQGLHCECNLRVLCESQLPVHSVSVDAGSVKLNSSVFLSAHMNLNEIKCELKFYFFRFHACVSEFSATHSLSFVLKSKLLFKILGFFGRPQAFRSTLALSSGSISHPSKMAILYAHKIILTNSCNVQ